MFKLSCPNNSSHKEFVATAHITQDWKTDENGNFLDVVTECVDVIHTPNECNYWECSICGAEATIKTI